MSSPRSVKTFSSLVQPFYLSFRSISTIHGGVSRRNSQILKTEEEFSLNLAPFSSRFVVLVQGHPLIIVLIVRIPFTYLESINSGLFILSHQLSFSYLAGASIEYPLISS